jgi:hypothetical protein
MSVINPGNFQQCFVFKSACFPGTQRELFMVIRMNCPLRSNKICYKRLLVREGHMQALWLYMHTHTVCWGKGAIAIGCSPCPFNDTNNFFFPPGMFHTPYLYYTPYRIYHVLYRIWRISPYNTILGTYRFLQPQAPKSPPEGLPSPPEPPRGTPSPSERCIITSLFFLI